MSLVQAILAVDPELEHRQSLAVNLDCNYFFANLLGNKHVFSCASNKHFISVKDILMVFVYVVNLLKVFVYI